MGLGATFTWLFAFYEMYTYLGTFLSTTLHYSTIQSGSVLLLCGLGNFAASLGAGWVTAQWGPKRTVLVAGLVAAGLMAGLPWITGNPVPVLMVLLIL